jgi:flagellar basal body-associated protein FliL
MPRKKKSKKSAQILVSVIIIIAIFCIFFSFGPGKMFFMSVTNANNFSPNIGDDVSTIFQTGGLLLFMCGFPVIATLVILGICKFGSAIAQALMSDDEEEEDDNNKDTTA